jgi:excinuclease ABC subunit C
VRLNSQDFPERPGVYLFKTSRGRVLYVGKARNLRRRLAQHWQRRDSPVLASLLARAARVETVTTGDEKDALLLEHSLVQHHLPPFNIRLKDDKSYPLLEIDAAEEWPGIFFVRRRSPGGFVFGPLVSSARARELIDLVTRLFLLRTCSAVLFRQGKPCLFHHIGRCSAPCAGKIDSMAYRAAVSEAIAFLNGRTAPLRRAMKARMNRLASELRFEEAEQVRQDMELIVAFSPGSWVVTPVAGSYDVLAALTDGHQTAAALFAVVSGKVRESNYYMLETVAEAEDDVLAELLLDLYRHRPIPSGIVVPFLPADAGLLQDLLSQTAGRKVRLGVPKRGPRRALLAMALDNLQQYVCRSDYNLLGRRLQDLLGLGRFPSRIEGYDISHTSEQRRVGAMVAFVNGRPQRRDYRSYIIRRAPPGDTFALAEVLERRLAKAENLPDLLLIDGGKPQLGAALEVVERLKAEVEVIALAKGEERVFLANGGSLVPEEGTPERHLLQSIRDEVHRRAVSHHRKRRDALR